MKPEITMEELKELINAQDGDFIIEVLPSKEADSEQKSRIEQT